MIDGIPRISVRIITYNQEKLIKRAIDSLLRQIDYVYEICISDDCSPDGTWDILKDYEQRYPGLFKLHRNEHNIGIFQNIEQSWTMPSGDIVYGLAGDDECGDNWFKEVIEFIQRNGIDYKNELFCIYGDYEVVRLDGRRCRVSNSQISSGKDPISLAMRWKISNRGCCYSIRVLKQFKQVSLGRSYIAEAAQDRQLQFFSQTNYYIPIVGNRYYSEIGVSTGLKNPDRISERANRYEYLHQWLNSNEYSLNKRDKRFCKYVRHRTKLPISGGLLNRFACLYYRLLSFSPGIDSPRVFIKEMFSILVLR